MVKLKIGSVSFAGILLVYGRCFTFILFNDSLPSLHIFMAVAPAAASACFLRLWPDDFSSQKFNSVDWRILCRSSHPV